MQHAIDTHTAWLLQPQSALPRRIFWDDPKTEVENRNRARQLFNRERAADRRQTDYNENTPDIEFAEKRAHDGSRLACASRNMMKRVHSTVKPLEEIETQTLDMQNIYPDQIMRIGNARYGRPQARQYAYARYRQKVRQAAAYRACEPVNQLGDPEKLTLKERIAKMRVGTFPGDGHAQMGQTRQGELFDNRVMLVETPKPRDAAHQTIAKQIERAKMTESAEFAPIEYGLGKLKTGIKAVRGFVGVYVPDEREAMSLVKNEPASYREIELDAKTPAPVRLAGVHDFAMRRALDPNYQADPAQLKAAQLREKAAQTSFGDMLKGREDLRERRLLPHAGPIEAEVYREGAPIEFSVHDGLRQNEFARALMKLREPYQPMISEEEPNTAVLSRRGVTGMFKGKAATELRMFGKHQEDEVIGYSQAQVVYRPKYHGGVRPDFSTFDVSHIDPRKEVLASNRVFMPEPEAPKERAWDKLRAKRYNLKEYHEAMVPSKPAPGSIHAYNKDLKHALKRRATEYQPDAPISYGTQSVGFNYNPHADNRHINYKGFQANFNRIYGVENPNNDYDDPIVPIVATPDYNKYAFGGPDRYMGTDMLTPAKYDRQLMRKGAAYANGVGPQPELGLMLPEPYREANPSPIAKFGRASLVTRTPQ